MRQVCKIRIWRAVAVRTDGTVVLPRAFPDENASALGKATMDNGAPQANGSLSLMPDKAEKPRISGKDATHAAMEAEKYGPIRVRAADDSGPHCNESADTAQVPAQVKGTPDSGHPRKAPPRVRKLSPQHDQLLAPTPDLEGYRA